MGCKRVAALNQHAPSSLARPHDHANGDSEEQTQSAFGGRVGRYGSFARSLAAKCMERF